MTLARSFLTTLSAVFDTAGILSEGNEKEALRILSRPLCQRCKAPAS